MVRQVWRNYVVAAAVMLIPAAGCAREPEQLSLSAVAINYSEDDIARVLINGEEAGSGLNAVRPGNVSGGGSIVCCLSLTQGQRDVEVAVQTAKDTYTTTAEIEQSWTKYASYVIVHVLPKRKIVVEISPDNGAPRKDLLDQRRSELGIPQEAEYLLHLMRSGPTVDVE